MRNVKLAGHDVPAIGQGTWYMGESAASRAVEVAALQQGIDLGMTLIDTAEMYAEGGAEQVVGAAIAGRRDQVFLVSKVYPHNASRRGIPQACERSLRRLGTDCIDLYLLPCGNRRSLRAPDRRRQDPPLGRFQLRCRRPSGTGRRALRGEPGAVQPGRARHRVRPVALEPSAASADHGRSEERRPLAQGGRLLRHPLLQTIAERHGATPAQVSLAWVIRQDGVIAIPKAVSPEHVRLNAEAGQLRLSDADLREIDQAFAPPRGKQRLAMQ